MDRPLYLNLNTPYDGNVVKITNTGPVEYPLTASVVRPRFRGDFRIPNLRLKQTAELCLQTDTVRILIEVL